MKNKKYHTVRTIPKSNIKIANRQIKVITKLPNSEQSYKGKVKTHNYRTECDNIHKVIEQHGEYMENFLAAVTTKLVALVDIGLQLQYNVDKATQPLCSDVHVHLKHLYKFVSTI
jgi:hypothetical protein